MRNAAERGNVLFIILLGVVLFGALSWAVRQGFQGTNERLTQTRMEALADDIIMTGAGYEKAINRMINKGISENRMSFTRIAGDGYELSPASDPTEQVFNINGGGAQYLDPAKDSLDITRSSESGYGSWLYSGFNKVDGIGLNTATNSAVDLVAILPYVRLDVCTAINKRLGVNPPTGTPPVHAGGMDVAAKFTGTFSLHNSILTSGISITGQKAACIQGYQDTTGASISGRYYFYYVLIAR